MSVRPVESAVCNFIPPYMLEYQASDLEQHIAELENDQAAFWNEDKALDIERYTTILANIRATLQMLQDYIEQGRLAELAAEFFARTIAFMTQASNNTQDTPSEIQSKSQIIHKIWEQFDRRIPPNLLLSSDPTEKFTETDERMRIQAATANKRYEQYNGNKLVSTIDPDSPESIIDCFGVVENIKQNFHRFGLLQKINIEICVLYPGIDVCNWNFERVNIGFTLQGRHFQDSLIKSKDLLLHELGHAAIQEIGFERNFPPGTFITAKRRDGEKQGENNALAEHLADVLTIMLKHFETFPHQDFNYSRYEKDADWCIGRGILSRDEGFALRNMKNPGTAHTAHSIWNRTASMPHWPVPKDVTDAKAGIADDILLSEDDLDPKYRDLPQEEKLALLEQEREKILARKRLCQKLMKGEDPQPSHLRDFFELPWEIDHKGAHIFCGIPSCAFSKVAAILKCPSYGPPGDIWIQAIRIADQDECFESFAEKTVAAAIAYKRGKPSAKKDYKSAVLDAWNDVGVLLPQDEAEYESLLQVIYASNNPISSTAPPHGAGGAAANAFSIEEQALSPFPDMPISVGTVELVAPMYACSNLSSTPDSSLEIGVPADRLPVEEQGSSPSLDESMRVGSTESNTTIGQQHSSRTHVSKSSLKPIQTATKVSVQRKTLSPLRIVSHQAQPILGQSIIFSPVHTLQTVRLITVLRQEQPPILATPSYALTPIGMPTTSFGHFVYHNVPAYSHSLFLGNESEMMQWGCGYDVPSIDLTSRNIVVLPPLREINLTFLT